jgi:hypothetical protein
MEIEERPTSFHGVLARRSMAHTGRRSKRGAHDLEQIGAEPWLERLVALTV